ncbi:MAG: acyltransferase family protein [Paracoccaceae bacterium]
MSGGRHLKYRPDIDGLRAVAVLAVVFYHAGIPPFGGGFVGVDVFFVISGFLITSILRDEIGRGEFRLLAFYERRVRRLFPALFVVLAASSAAAWAMLLPEDMRNFGQSLAAANLFVSNVLFWKEAGYFDTAAEFKPLLHTWSLAVEEQYYLFFPLLMALGARAFRHWLGAVLLAIGAVSLAIAAWQVAHAPDAAFFLLPARFWELLVGAALAFSRFPAPTRRGATEAMAAGGMAMIALPVFAYSDVTPFPGLAALLPCLGTALLVLTGTDGKSHVHAALRSAPTVFVGLISYSLYLWHWPVLVFAKYYTVRPLTALETAAAVCVSVALAVLSWRFVEKPFRGRGSAVTRQAIFTGAAVASALAVAFGLAAARNAGFPGRLPADVLALTSEDPHIHSRRDCHFASEKASAAEFCLRGAKGQAPRFLLLGDSHADMHGPGLFAAAAALGLTGVQFTDYGYVPAPGFARAGEQDRYAGNQAKLEDLLAAYPEIDLVIYALFWNQALDYPVVAGPDGRKHPLPEALQRLVTAYPQKRFVFLEDTPNSVVLGPNGLARAAYLNPAPAVVPLAEYEAQLGRHRPLLETVAQAPNAVAVRLSPQLCGAGGCDGMDGEVLLYRDTDHLSEKGSLRMRGFFRNLLLEHLFNATDRTAGDGAQDT